MTDLSGRVDTLELWVTQLAQDILQRPDLQDNQTFQTQWNTQLNQISDALTSAQNMLRTLQALYINLNIVVDDHWTSFKTHTGLYVTGANATHHGV